MHLCGVGGLSHDLGGLLVAEGRPFDLCRHFRRAGPGATCASENFRNAWRVDTIFGDYASTTPSWSPGPIGRALIVILGAMAAYALSRFYHPLGRVVFWLFLAGLMIPAQLAIVPLFFELRAAGLLNSMAGLILVYTANGLLPSRYSSWRDFSARSRALPFTTRR